MSKFRYATMAWSESSFCCWTQCSEPKSPSSSPVQNAKRTVRGVGPRSASRSASSRMVMVPDPLSLMPGPSMTESRCPPIMITWSGVAPGPDPSRSPMTLAVSRSSFRVCTVRWTDPPAAAAWRSASPTSFEAYMAGISIPSGSRSVGRRTAPGSYAGELMTSAAAPAPWACSTMSLRKHWPGPAIAMAPAGKSTQSERWQPPEPTMLPSASTATATTGAVTSPDREKIRERRCSSPVNVWPPTIAIVAGLVWKKNGKVNSSRLTE